MCWIQTALVFSFLLPLLQAHRDCTQDVRWGDLLEDLNSLSSRISYECEQHFDQTTLCDPHKMLNMMEHNAKTVANIMRKAEAIYKKNEKSHRFVVGLLNAHNTLKCAQHSLEENLEPVTACFEKMEVFLDHKKSHPDCAWQIVTAKTREILQRLERRTVRKRR